MKIGTRATVASVACVIALGIVVVLVWARADRKLRSQQEELVKRQAISIGVNTAQQVAATRAVYASSVVGSLKPHGVEFAQKPDGGQAPLPAVFVGEIARKIKENGGSDSVSFVLRSKWNINPTQGLTSEFEKHGWDHLEKQLNQNGNKSEPYWEQTNLADGTPVIRVMTPDIANAKSCVSCHNELEKSSAIAAMRGGQPAKSFRLGDLMGAIVTTVPIAQSKALVAGIEASQSEATTSLWIAILVAVLATALVGVYVGRLISRRVEWATEVIDKVCRGDLTQRLCTETNDEIGLLASRFNVFIDGVQELVKKIRTTASSLQSSSSELNKTSVKLDTGATSTREQAICVSSATEEMSVTLKSMTDSTDHVAENVDAFNQSIQEMRETTTVTAGKAETAAESSKAAAETVKLTSEKVSELGGSADAIGEVLETIQEIAEQTNLLALNATIEAARAGEAGKGFAVVATEVKELAKQTADATEVISQRINSIQTSTNEAIQAIENIGEAVSGVTQSSQEIANRVQEQNAKNQSIANSVRDSTEKVKTLAIGFRETSVASSDIARSICDVDEVAASTVELAKRTNQSSEELSSMAAEVHNLVSKFNA